MKNFVVLIALFFALSFYSCQDPKEDTVNVNPVVARYKNVGHQIPVEVGKQWIEAYNERNNTQNRIGGLLYSIDHVQWQALLTSVTELIGVAFQYGVDESGTKHIIAIPVDEELRLWTSIPGRIYVDANTGTEISQSVAYTWAQRYQAQHPDGVWFHYFGKNVFDEILTIPYFSRVDIVQAINILGLTPELLLIVTDLDVLSLGRVADAENTAVYDASYPCPRCDVQ